VDGVFNHVGREFFAFKDVKEKRENSAYKEWFKNLHFDWNNDYNDGLYYDSWDGHGTLVNLNHQNPAVREYMLDVVRFWISEFDIDGIRLDAADVLDFTFMSELRSVTDSCKKDFWLMGEVIHGDYTRWVNENMLQSVTNYWLHKALYSGHNDHNYFEIAHTVKRCTDMGMHIANAFYNFVDNHDVARIYTKLNNKNNFAPVHVLLYTLPGKPSIYYGSEFAIEGEKKPYADDILRPELNFEDYKTALESNENTKLIAALGNMRISNPWVGEAGYRELLLTNRQYAFLREYGDKRLVAIVNNDDNNMVTEDELRAMVEVSHEDGVIEKEEKKMIVNVVDFGDTVAGDIMLPRVDMVMVSVESSYGEILKIFREERYTRIPVYEESPDNVIGILNVKDFLLIEDKENFSVKEHLREPLYTYEYKKTSSLMVDMRKTGANIVIVLDEYGTTVGLITLEDMLEEIVGEIRDEFDADEDEGITKISETEYLIDGSTNLDDVNDRIGLELSSEEYESIGGIIMEKLGRLPVEGEVITFDNIILTVKKMDHARIEKVGLKLKPSLVKEQ